MSLRRHVVCSSKLGYVADEELVDGMLFLDCWTCTCVLTVRTTVSRVINGVRCEPYCRIMLASIVVGVLLRLVIGTFLTYSFDVNYWVTTSENIVAGEGLYESPGYYYTPVWGYVLAVAATVANMFGIPFGHYDQDAVIGSALNGAYLCIPDLGYALLLKAILMAFDLIAGYFIFKIVELMTDDKRKASVSFAIWFLFPLTILLSSERVMFECIELAFMLMAVYMAFTDRPCMAGVAIAISLLTKPYGAFIAVLLIGYFLAKDKKVIDAVRYIVSTAVTGLVIMAPTLLEGNLLASQSWATSRVGDSASGYDLMMLVAPILVILCIVGIAMVYKHRITDCRAIMTIGLVITSLMLIAKGHVQYYLVLVPFVAILGCGTFKYPLIPLALLGIVTFITGAPDVTSTYVRTGLPGASIIASLGEINTGLYSSMQLVLKYASGWIAILFACLSLKQIMKRSDV